MAITERLGEAKAAFATGKETIGKIKHADESAIHKANARQLTPPLMASSVCAAAAIGLAFPPLPSIVGGSLAVAALTAGIMIPQRSPLRLLESIHAWAKTHPAHTILCGVAALTWFVLAQILGLGGAPLLSFLGLAGFYLLSARWWKTHRRGYADPNAGRPAPGLPTGEPPAEVEVVPEQDRIVTRWTQTIAAGGILRNTYLRFEKEVGRSREYRLHLDPGKQSIDTVWSSIKLISTGLGVRPENMQIDEILPSQDNPDPDPAIISFKVITSPIKESPLLSGSAYVEEGKNGWVELGEYIDGLGWARWNLFTEDSVWSGFLVGRTGSGKSILLDTIALSIMSTGKSIILYIDGKNGGSSPALFDAADWSLGLEPDQWDTMLTGVENLIKARNAENRARLKVAGFTPSPRRPAVFVIVDECHVVFDYKKLGSNWAERWANVARTGRSVGVGIIAASQIYTLDTFGGSDALRDSLLAGNGVGLKLGRNQSSLMGSGADAFDPSRLPGIPGRGMVLGGTSSGTTATAPFQGRYNGDKVAVAEMIRRAGTCQPQLDRLSAGSINIVTEGAYAKRHEAAAESLDDLEKFLQSIEDGTADSSMPWDADTDPEKVLALLDTGLPDFATFMADYASQQEQLRDEAEASLNGSYWKKMIYRAIRSGLSTTAEIISYVNEQGEKGRKISQSYFYEAIDGLKEAGLIDQIGPKGTGYTLKELTPS